MPEGRSTICGLDIAIGDNEAIESDIAGIDVEDSRGITTADGEPVEMTSTTKAQLLDRAAVADALVVTFFDAHEKARAKN